MKKVLILILLILLLFAGCRSPDPMNTLSTGPPGIETESLPTFATVRTEYTPTFPVVLPSLPIETLPAQPLPTEDSPPQANPSNAVIPSEPVSTLTPPTEVRSTEPTQTDPPIHIHNYSVEIINPTCTTGGYTIHTCFCGDSYTDCPTPSVGHSYTETITAPTMWQQGYSTFICLECSDSYIDNYTNISEAGKDAFIQEVRDTTLQYISQFRLEHDSTEVQSLPGLTEVANYRAVQLHNNFAHSTTDLREALAYYQYGEYKTPAGWDPSEYYYDFSGREAISRSSKTGTAEEIGRQFAQNFLNSSSHWDYVGSSEYSYSAVGIAYDASVMYCWTCCVFVTNTGQYG